MPSSNALDPTNYETVVAGSDIRWHDGSGTITYTFLTFVPDSYSEIDADTWDVGGLAVPKSNTVGLDANQEALVAQAMGAYNDVANLHITYVAGAADIEIGAYAFDDPGLFGFAYYPGSSGYNGDLWLNNSLPIVATPSLGDEGWVTILHELGHAVGLKHPFEDTPLLASALDTSQYTVMSYDPHPSSSAIWPLTPMLYDILALQTLYGVNTATRAGATTYFGAGPASVYALADNDAMILTVWDAGGIDTFDASNQTRAVKIDLVAGHFSSIGSLTDNVAIAFNAVIENAYGGGGNDTLTGNAAANVLRGGAGNDTIDGAGGTDTAGYAGAAGAVTVSLMLTGPQATGGAGVDTLTNIESLVGSNYADRLIGNAAANKLMGSFGADILTGNNGNDTLEGGAGGDLLSGNAHNDLLYGNDGNDTLIGGLGADRLWGGAGIDRFRFDTGLNPNGNVDMIGDFSVADDTIMLARTTFQNAGSAGTLTAGGFYKGPAAHDVDDRIIYQASTGALLYDADGNGAGAAIRFATLGVNLALTNADFVLV